MPYDASSYGIFWGGELDRQRQLLTMGGAEGCSSVKVA